MLQKLLIFGNLRLLNQSVHMQVTDSGVQQTTDKGQLEYMNHSNFLQVKVVSAMKTMEICTKLKC